MKVIFLDIDGVLTSANYDRQKTENDTYIDKSRLALIKGLVDKTGAKIVLSSSWRKSFEPDCDSSGIKLIETFAEAGLEIYGKTPEIGYIKRPDEVRAWLAEHPDVDAFVMFDDDNFDLGDLREHFIKTNYRIGRGLGEEHIEAALALLV